MLIIVPTAREAQHLFDGPVPSGGTPVRTRVNEVAVDAFLCGTVGFTGIPAIIKKTMDAHADDGGPWGGRA